MRNPAREVDSAQRHVVRRPFKMANQEPMEAVDTSAKKKKKKKKESLLSDVMS